MWLAFFPSCNQEIEPVTPEEEPVPEGCYFRANPESPEDESKTFLSKNESKWEIWWNVGEKLKVRNSAEETADFESMDKARKALFYYDGTDFAMSAPYFAIYPATGSILLTDGNPTFGYTVSATQSAPADNIADGTNVAVGWAGADKELHMMNLNAYIRFQITEENLINKAIIRSTNGSAVAGTVTQPCTYDGSTLSLGANSSPSPSESIILTPSEGDYFTSGLYYIAILPGSFPAGKLQLDLMNGDKLVSRKTNTKGVSYQRNKIYNLGNVTPSDMAEAFGKSTSIVNVTSFSRRQVRSGVTLYEVKTKVNVNETPTVVNFQILEVELSAAPAYDLRCALPYDASTPWITDGNWATQDIASGTNSWVESINNGDEYVLALFPNADYNDAVPRVPNGPVHSRGTILQSTTNSDNNGVVSVNRGASAVNSLVFSSSYSSSIQDTPSTYTDLGGYKVPLILNGSIQSVSDDSSGPVSAIGYKGSTNGKLYYVLTDGGHPSDVQEVMKNIGCSDAALQHRRALGKLVVENAGTYSAFGSGTDAMTAWALVMKKQLSGSYRVGSAYRNGCVDGDQSDLSQICLSQPQSLCWKNEEEGIIYFVQRGTYQGVSQAAIRECKVTEGARYVKTLQDSSSIGYNYLRTPWACCSMTLDGKPGVLVSNKNATYDKRLMFIHDDGTSGAKAYPFTWIANVPYDQILDIKLDDDRYIWFVSHLRGHIVKGEITGDWPNFSFTTITDIDVSGVEDEYGGQPSCLTFDKSGNAIYGTWQYSEGHVPGIYLIPAASLAAGTTVGVARIAGDGAQSGNALGDNGDQRTALFPVLYGINCGSDNGLYIACGASANSLSIRKLIPVLKSDGSLDANSYIKGRMISFHPQNMNPAAASGIILKSDCSEAVVTDLTQHRIAKISVTNP